MVVLDVVADCGGPGAGLDSSVGRCCWHWTERPELLERAGGRRWALRVVSAAVVVVGVVAAETTAASGNRIEGSNRRNFVG